jgi:YaiO family outer membrane protein
MRSTPLLFIIMLFSCATAVGQGTSAPTVAPGSSLPGLGGVSLGLNGPGYLELGGSHSALTNGYSDWNDFYARAMLSGGHNVWTGELTREGRFGSAGWLYNLGLNRTLSEDWYAQFSAASSVGGFFLNRFTGDAIINRKLLSRRQLVATVGLGFDQSKTVDKDERLRAEAAYYFNFPLVVQGGAMWTHASPGNILARTEYIAATEGYDKEHFFSLRYEWGREGYEVVGEAIGPTPTYNVLADFHERTITGTWRQWIGPKWGVNLNAEQHQEPYYHRWGGTGGVFFEF